MAQVDARLYPIATRTRRTGLKLAGTARDSRDTSLTSTIKAIQWDASTYSNEMPLQVRFKAANAMRILSDLGVEGSTATSRAVVGVPGSTTYTSIASATWSEFEDVSANHRAASEDGVYSNVLCFVAGTGLLSYEVRTVPRGQI